MTFASLYDFHIPLQVRQCTFPLLSHPQTSLSEVFIFFHLLALLIWNTSFKRRETIGQNWLADYEVKMSFKLLVFPAILLMPGCDTLAAILPSSPLSLLLLSRYPNVL